MRKLIVGILVGVWMLWGSAVSANTSYTVQRGDTLASIARRFNTTVNAIAAANNIINPNLIYVNQVLVIPGSGGEIGVQPLEGEPRAVYIVQPGETMMRIALRYGTSVAALAQINGIANPNRIYVGQALQIPGVNSLPAVPTPVVPSAPVEGHNLLPNGSFEDGWYNMNGVAELQLPNGWRLEWDEGRTEFGSAAWDVYRRPETRVLSAAFLPPAEQNLFIREGRHAVKIFKGSGPMSARLLTDLTLSPGSYELMINVFPDLVAGYEGGRKLWAPDPTSGEVKLVAGPHHSGWLKPHIGQPNQFTFRFTVNGTQTLAIGAALRGRYAIENNGWFIDNWSLKRLP